MNINPSLMVSEACSPEWRDEVWFARLVPPRPPRRYFDAMITGEWDRFVSNVSTLR